MRLVYVPLQQETIRKLVDLAYRERRRPQDQAAYLIEKALQKEDRQKRQRREASHART